MVSSRVWFRSNVQLDQTLFLRRVYLNRPPGLSTFHLHLGPPSYDHFLIFWQIRSWLLQHFPLDSFRLYHFLVPLAVIACSPTLLALVLLGALILSVHFI